MQGAFQYGILAPFRRPPPDPAQLQLPPRHYQEIEDSDHLAGGDGPHIGLRCQAADRQQPINRVYKRGPNAQREAAFVETLRRVDRPYMDNEMDSVQPGTEQNSSGVSDIENQEETLQEPAGADVSDSAPPLTRTNTEAAKSDSDHFEKKQQKGNKRPNKSEQNRTGDALEALAEGESAPAEVQVSLKISL